MNYLLLLTFICLLINIKGDDLMCYRNCMECNDTNKLVLEYCGPEKTSTSEKPTSPTSPTLPTEKTIDTTSQEEIPDIKAEENIDKHACYRALKKDTWHYGCNLFPDKAAGNDCKNLVDLLETKVDDLSNCNICRTDGCNDSNNSNIAKLSLFAFISIFLLKLII